MSLVYYSQEDPRWKNILYSIRNDKTQTIGTSACGPTCAAMAISSLTGKELLPPAAAAYAVANGYRTANSGTAWGFFASIAKQYGLEVIQTGSLDQVLVALAAGKLVVASMRPGHFTGGGHFILLVDVNQSDGVNWIDVLDPNHDNTKYGADGLVDQGVRNDGKVTAKESVFRKEAGQYWIFDKPEEEDQPMTKEERALLDSVITENKVLATKVEALESKASMKMPSWAESAVVAAKNAGIIDTVDGGSYDFYRVLTVMHRKGLI
ncbi:C39 family peptidase [Paenibacillus thailandensis]|uniref:C39 family peptidase n=1 Tax=Paenibacillus thailandensis TaxID=393250 RepID=A0ABW5R2R6_9BACL